MRLSKPMMMLPLLVSFAATGALAADPNATAVPASANMAPPSALPPATSSHDPAPMVPSPRIGKHVGVVRQAGRGGPTAYAREGVMELGGGVSFASATDYLQLSIAPTVGYFLTNNFELSFQVNVSYSRIGGHGNYLHPTYATALVTPSFHLPVTDSLFVYGGLGIGAGYLRSVGFEKFASSIEATQTNANSTKTTVAGITKTRHHGWGFAAQPELGLNMMVGRSGIVSPFANVTLATNKLIKNDEGTQVGLNAIVGAGVRYSVMW